MASIPRAVLALSFAFAAAACANSSTIDESGSSGEPSGGPSSGPSGAGGSAAGGNGAGGTSSPTSSGSPSSGSPSTGSTAPAGTGGSSSAAGDGGTSGTGDTTTSATVSSSGTGAPCASDAACEDGDPCTSDACDGAAGCVRDAVAPGQLGTPEGGGCAGVCQVDGSCGWSLYERTFQPGAPFARRALSAAWSGANAPPPRGILAAERLYGSDLLLVFADDGNTYVRKDGAWLLPLVTAVAFAGIDAAAIDSAQTFKLYATDATEYLYLTTRGPTRYGWQFLIDATPVITPTAGNPFALSDAGAGAPPQGSADCDFQLNHQFAYADQGLWIDTWVGFQGNTWVFDNATFAWIDRGPLTSSPLGGGMPGGPAAGTTRAVYIDAGTLAFVAP